MLSNVKWGTMNGDKQQKEDNKPLMRMLVIATALAVAIILAVVVIINLAGLSRTDTLPTLNLVEYPVCSAETIASDDSLDRYDDSAEVRCLTDNDRLVISKATYTPQADDAENTTAKRAYIELGEDCNSSDNYCEHTMSGDIDKQSVKEALDRRMDYISWLSLGPSKMDDQVVSTIEETPTEYVYTYYLNSPAYAECIDWDYELPPGMTIYKIPSYNVDFGETCDGNDDYVEYRGVTRVGTIKINKVNPVVRITRGSTGLYLDESQETVLVHDATHYIYLGNEWCQGELWCEKN